MQIVEMQLDRITPYERNPRRNNEAVEYVANSIREFGFRVPIVIDASGVIVAGHTRYKAAQALGMSAVPCVVADDLTDAQIRAYRLADNKTAEMAQWDPAMLDEELMDLLDIDMSAFGFGDIDLDAAVALDLDAEQSRDKPDKQQCHCPKCGFVFEV